MRWLSPRAWFRGAPAASKSEPRMETRTVVDGFASTLLKESMSLGDTDSSYEDTKRRIVRSIIETEESLLAVGIDIFSPSGSRDLDSTISIVFPPSELARKASRTRMSSGQVLLVPRSDRERKRCSAKGGKLALEEGMARLASCLHQPGERAILELASYATRRSYFFVFYRGNSGLNTTRSISRLAEIAFQLPDDVVLVRIEDTTLYPPRR